MKWLKQQASRPFCYRRRSRRLPDWNAWIDSHDPHDRQSKAEQNNFFCEDRGVWSIFFHLFQNLCETINEITATFFFPGINDVLKMKK